MREYGQAAILEMYFKALPDVAKNIAEPLKNIDKITMYGEGNNAKMVGDITNSLTQISEGLNQSMGVDIKSIFAGALGQKVIDKNKYNNENKEVKEKIEAEKVDIDIKEKE